MEMQVVNLEGKKSGTVKLDDSVFGLDPRADILHRMVRYQRAKARQGTHHTQGRSDVNRTGARLFRQKGTGNARHHAASAPQFRGGGKAHGPKTRDHSHDLPKKFRKLALRHALSAKAKAGGLRIVNELSVKEAKTSAVRAQLDKLRMMDKKLAGTLMIGGAELDRGFVLATRNIPDIDVLPLQGINVYDILRRPLLVLSKDALKGLEERFQ